MPCQLIYSDRLFYCKPQSRQSARPSLQSSELAPPALLPPGECCPPPFGSRLGMEGGGGGPGTHSLAGEGAGGTNLDEGTDSLVLLVKYNPSTLQTLLPQCTYFLKKDAKMEKLEIGVIFCQ